MESYLTRESMVNGKVLLIDDDLLFAKIMTRQLDSLGYEVISRTKNFEGFHEDLQEHEIDIIIIDFFLGEIDGVELMKSIHSQYDQPVIFVTSSNDSKVLDSILSVTPEGFIDKNRLNNRELQAMLQLTLYKKKKDLELRDLNEQLDRKVKERTEELDEAIKALVREMSEKEVANKKLEKSLKAEKEFSRQKTDIISNLSHEFKTPISSIKSSAQLIQRMLEKASSADEKYAKHLQRIIEGTEIMNDLIVRILSFEKKGSFELNKEILSMDILPLWESYKQRLDLLRKPDQKINYEERIALDMVNIDPKLTSLVLENVVSNALKYSDDEASVDVSFMAIDQPKRLEISVRDNGIGIDQDDLANIFKRFYRGKNVGSIEGTGIGMSIVKRVLKILDGEIAIDSKVNEGTTVQITIPLTANS